MCLCGICACLCAGVFMCMLVQVVSMWQHTHVEAIGWLWVLFLQWFWSHFLRHALFLSLEHTNLSVQYIQGILQLWNYRLVPPCSVFVYVLGIWRQSLTLAEQAFSCLDFFKKPHPWDFLHLITDLEIFYISSESGLTSFKKLPVLSNPSSLTWLIMSFHPLNSTNVSSDCLELKSICIDYGFFSFNDVFPLLSHPTGIC